MKKSEHLSLAYSEKERPALHAIFGITLGETVLNEVRRAYIAGYREAVHSAKCAAIYNSKDVLSAISELDN